MICWVMKKKKPWKTVQIPEALLVQIEAYIKTQEGKKRGLTSVSAYVSHAIRKELGY